MNLIEKEALLENMVSNLPLLRKALGLSQTGLAELVGLDRSSIAAIENRKRKLPWDTFLALVLIFSKNAATDNLLPTLEVYTDGLEAFIKLK